jgi:hypothetical protein
MKLTVPHIYKFFYVPRGCINDRDSYGRASVEIEIAELDDSDAPVVFKVANPDNSGSMAQGYNRFCARPDGEPRRVRMRDGIFYVEGLSVEEFVTQTSSIADLNGTFLSWIGGDVKPGEDKSRRVTITSINEVRWNRNFGPLREEKTRDDGGAKIGAKIAAQAAKMMIIDGVTYERCREPILSIVMSNGDDTSYGIVEAFKSQGDRSDVGRYSYMSNASFTSSLIHADHTMRQAGVDPAVVHIEIIDPRASSYDGVASDIIYHMERASGELKDATSAASNGTLHAYYRVAEALEHVDHGSPSISAEIIAAAQGILDVGSDPDIDEPMRELARAAYVTDRSSNRHLFADADAGGPFHFGYSHASDYKDILGNMRDARRHAEHIVSRWEGRHPDATFDNGQTHRMTSRVEGGIAVTEIGSASQARRAARDLGTPYSLVDVAIENGSRLFVLSGRKLHKDSSVSAAAQAGLIGLVISPAAGNPNAWWEVVTTDHPSADQALDAVSNHTENMHERDLQMTQDQQPISIF